MDPWRRRWKLGALAGALGLSALTACTSDKEPTPAPPTPAAVVAPGEYLAPLARLQRIEGQVQHLHTDEVRYRDDGKLLQCSYTFGVLDVQDPANVRYLAENIKHTIPDDERKPGCIHLAADGDIVYTTHRGNISNPAFLSGWDISPKDPADQNGVKLKPVQLPVVQEPGESYEGVDVSQGHIYVALRDKGLGVYRRDPATNAITRVGALSGIGNTWGLRAQGDRVYLSDVKGGLVTVDVSDPTAPRLLGRADFDGVGRGVEVNDDIVYVAAGPGGLVIVDVSDPTAPKVVGQADTPGTAVRVAYAKDHAYVAAWNDARAYDVSDPTKPRFVGATRLTQQATFGPTAGDLEVGRPPVTARTLGIAAHDDFAFVGNWWVLYSYRLHPERVAANILIPEDANTIDFGLVPAGESKTVPLEITNQGTAPLNLYHNWVEGEAFQVTPKQVQVPPGEKTTLELTFTPSGAPAAADSAGSGTPAGATDGSAAAAEAMAPEWSTLHIRSDDPEFPVRTAFLTANRPGLGVGRPLPETRVALLDGGEWSSAEAAGKVQVLAYFATF